MSEIKIRVSTHDNDTTDIELSRIGTKLKVSLGDKKAEIDIAEFIPAIMADRFLADATYDENTKELVLITRKEGEEDKEFRVPISHIFQIEVEELFTKEQGVDFGMVQLSHNGIQLSNPGNRVYATALGKIKGTGWYVFKFDEDQINEFRTKLAIELAKRDVAPSDFSPVNEKIIAISGDASSYTVKLNINKIILNNVNEIKKLQRPNRLYLEVNGERIATYYGDNDYTQFVTHDLESRSFSGDTVHIKLVAPYAHNGEDMVIGEYTIPFDQANKTLRDEAKDAFPHIPNAYSHFNNVFNLAGGDPVTAELNDLPIVKDINAWRKATLPWKLVAKANDVSVTYMLQTDAQGNPTYVRQNDFEPMSIKQDITTGVSVYNDKNDESSVHWSSFGTTWYQPTYDVE